MAALGKNRIIQPSQTAERQVDSTNRDVRLALGATQENIVSVNAHADALTPSFMPIDGLTDLLWPMNDVTGSLLAAQAVPGKTFPLTFGSGVAPGFVSELTGRCLRLIDTTPANVFARVSVPTPAYSTASMSCWFMPGVAPSSGTKFIFGNFDTAGAATHFNLFLNQNGYQIIFQAFVTIGGAGFQATAAGDSVVTAGPWRHLGVTHNGVTLFLYVDGRPIASIAAPGVINWTSGGGTVWNVGGTSAGANPLPGFIQDVRVHSAVRTREWFEEAFLRGKGRFF